MEHKAKQKKILLAKVFEKVLIEQFSLYICLVVNFDPFSFNFFASNKNKYVCVCIGKSSINLMWGFFSHHDNYIKNKLK